MSKGSDLIFLRTMTKSVTFQPKSLKMTAKKCNLVFYERNSVTRNHHSYILFASTLPDGRTIVGTIATLTADSPRPEHLSQIMDTNDVDEALIALEEIVEGFYDHGHWSKLSDCPQS